MDNIIILRSMFEKFCMNNLYKSEIKAFYQKYGKEKIYINLIHPVGYFKIHR